jgi:F-type H+-transporting ATPase subunit b
MARRWLVPLALGFVLGLIAPCLAGAAEATPKGQAPTAEQHAVPGHQILDLAIWTSVVFVVLLFVLGRYAWRPMLEGLQKREQRIRAALEDAEAARAETQRVRAQLQAEMDRAAEKVREILDEARRDAQHATDDMLGKARVEIQKERERMHRDIRMARDQALQEIWSQTAQLATLISAKAIRRQLNSDDHRRLVDEAITELRQAGKERQREVAGVQ